MLACARVKGGLGEACRRVCMHAGDWHFTPHRCFPPLLPLDHLFMNICFDLQAGVCEGAGRDCGPVPPTLSLL